MSPLYPSLSFGNSHTGLPTLICVELLGGVSTSSVTGIISSLSWPDPTLTTQRVKKHGCTLGSAIDQTWMGYFSPSLHEWTEKQS